MGTNRSRSRGTAPTKPGYRHKPSPGMSLADMSLLAIFVTSLILVPMALMAMAEETGPAANLKYLLVGFAAAGAAYGVNKFAVDTLAGLLADGFTMAGVVAVSSILLTGSGTSLGSFTGIVFGSVETKVYQEAGCDVADFIAAANEAGLAAERIAPAVEAVAETISATRDCEVASACLSGTGGGRGPMSRALETSANQAMVLVAALQEGALERGRQLGELNRQSGAYFEMLGDETRSMTDRRAELQGIHGQIRQAASALREAMPIALVQSYAQELQEGAVIAENPTGSRALSDFLRGHGGALAEQLRGLPQTELRAPDFPDRPGMADVMRYIPAFLAIAAIVLVGELILPLSLFLMTYMQIVREKEIADPNRRDGVAGDETDV
jgi:hypothetical protein